MKLRRKIKPEEIIVVESPSNGEVLFTNENDLMDWIVSGDTIEMSTDGGKTWEIWMEGLGEKSETNNIQRKN